MQVTRCYGAQCGQQNCQIYEIREIIRGKYELREINMGKYELREINMGKYKVRGNISIRKYEKLK